MLSRTATLKFDFEIVLEKTFAGIPSALSLKPTTNSSFKKVYNVVANVPILLSSDLRYFHPKVFHYPFTTFALKPYAFHFFFQTEGPPCKQCKEPTDVITFGARATLVRIDLPVAEGHLLLFKHEITHTCQPMDKKGKAVVSKETQDAIKEALPVFGGRFTSEKLKNSATTVAFEKMLSSPDGSPIDVYKVAREMQDARAVRDVMKEHRATQRAPERAADEEVNGYYPSGGLSHPNSDLGWLKPP
ncbi:hypothetical protein CYMTET_29501 [Cymbomonas tetramitiformis]|uniref:Uncharacterized protein n=1 Tax=Cymbomonas tetramitiformis TaxID=36881 RepID=A0AAE0KUW5_9CHLO|nr:hypothetical protein CYMTET_29501 [Cymbomonas tetramitiformis]